MTNYHLADFAVRFNNCITKRFNCFYVPYTNISMKTIALLQLRGCIRSFYIEPCQETGKVRVKVFPLYHETKPFIKSIELISKPGLRVYWSLPELSVRYFRNNFQGFYVVSTSQGIRLSDELIRTSWLYGSTSGEILLKINL